MPGNDKLYITLCSQWMSHNLGFFMPWSIIECVVFLNWIRYHYTRVGEVTIKRFLATLNILSTSIIVLKLVPILEPLFSIWKTVKCLVLLEENTITLAKKGILQSWSHNKNKKCICCIVNTKTIHDMVIMRK